MEAVAKDFCLKASFPALELLFPCVSQENFQKQAKWDLKGSDTKFLKTL